VIPSFLLKKLYVKGSLKNTENGFEFVIKNNIDSGTIIGVAPLAVGEASYPPAAMTVKTARGEWRGDEISSANAIFAPYGGETTISVRGQPLAPGEHQLAFALLTREAGRLQIELSDTV
jgi:hydroxymethylglutaryl-CoA reductase (NADPH)